MDIRKFSKYYQYSLKDKVIPITCGMNEEHPILVPNLDDNDRIYLYCLGCNFRMFPGVQLYQNIELILEGLDGKD